jgi:hydroxymethylpyrimidine/phosphomethylpyrimidine kinase
LTGRTPRILIIAGSDSGGGAGIQADIKTATVLGCFAMTAVTAITAQNTLGIHAVHVLPAPLVAAQIEACLSDIGADVIKIGMLGSAEIAATVADALAAHASNVPLVLDPVMVAKGGESLAGAGTIAVLKARLIQLATLVTPNIPEAQVLSGLTVSPGKAMAAAADAIRAMGAKAVLVKGGHAEGENVADVLVDGEAITVFASPRLDTRHTHGTGCTLSTAIACGIGQGMSLADAVGRAHDYVHEAIRTAPGFGSGRGPLNHMVRASV